MHNPREIEDLEDFKKTLCFRINAIIDHIDEVNPDNEQLDEDTIEELYSLIYYSREKL